MKSAEEIRKWLMQKYPYCNNGYEAWIARIETDIPMLVDFAADQSQAHDQEMIDLIKWAVTNISFHDTKKELWSLVKEKEWVNDTELLAKFRNQNKEGV